MIYLNLARYFSITIYVFTRLVLMNWCIDAAFPLNQSTEIRPCFKMVLKSIPVISIMSNKIIFAICCPHKLIGTTGIEKLITNIIRLECKGSETLCGRSDGIVNVFW